jgi:hypothetical protein
MADGYQVDAAAIDGLIEILGDAANYVREANAELGGFGDADLHDGWAARIALEDHATDERVQLLGNESLADAAASFADKWRYGLDKLDEAAEEVIGRLAETRQTYVDHERGMDNVFTRIFQTLDGDS